MELRETVNVPAKFEASKIRTLPHYLEFNYDSIEGSKNVIFGEGYLRVEGVSYKINSLENLIKLFKMIKDGYCQCPSDEHLREITKPMSEQQRIRFKEDRELDLGTGILRKQGNEQIIYKERHGKVFRNFKITNVYHFNNGLVVPEDMYKEMAQFFVYRLNKVGFKASNLCSIPSIARLNLMNDAKSTFFPLDSIEPIHIFRFMASVKGGPFRAKVLGDSPDVIVSDLVNAYAYILKYTPSPSPAFGYYVDSPKYHPEALFGAAKIKISMPLMELTPLAFRLGLYQFIPEGDVWLPSFEDKLTYPYGKIDEVWVNMPMLWLLIEKLGFKLDKDIKILEASWFIPSTPPQLTMRTWALKCLDIASNSKMYKFLYQMAPTGGKYFDKKKQIHVALPSFSPMILSHLFDMLRYLTFIGSQQCKGVKNITPDGWSAKSGNPNEITRVRVGGAEYGPFPVRNKSVDLFQFDPLRHDEGPDSDGYFWWRDFTEQFKDSNHILYDVHNPNSYNRFWSKPELISKSTPTSNPRLKPNVGDRKLEQTIPELNILLNNEVGSKSCSAQEIKRLVMLGH